MKLRRGRNSQLYMEFSPFSLLLWLLFAPVPCSVSVPSSISCTAHAICCGDCLRSLAAVLSFNCPHFSAHASCSRLESRPCRLGWGGCGGQRVSTQGAEWGIFTASLLQSGSCPCDSSLALAQLFSVCVLYLQHCLAWLLCWLWRQALSPEGNLEQGLG